MSVGEVGCLVLRDIKRESNLLGDEEPDTSVRDKPAENVHGILVQQRRQLLADGVVDGDECGLLVMENSQNLLSNILQLRESGAGSRHHFLQVHAGDSRCPDQLGQLLLH